MDAALRIKIAPEYLAVKYDCRVESDLEKGIRATVDNTRLSRLIQNGMECDVLLPGAVAWTGKVNGVKTDNGEVMFQILKTRQEVLSSRGHTMKKVI